jgi:glycosyltransferase 2 family protein
LTPKTVPIRSAGRTKKFRSWAIIILANLVSLICMTWVLKDAGLQKIWGEVHHMRWRWVCLAMVCDGAVYLLHGFRWQILLRPIMRVPFMQSVIAIYVGLFTNEVFPLRAGELVRCFLLAKSTEIPISVTFASALIERIFDGIWLMACFLITLHMGKLPGVLVKGGYFLGALIVVLGVVLAYAMYAKQQSLDAMFGIAWPKWFHTLIEDLHLIGHSRYLYYAFGISGLYLLAQILPIYCLVQANLLPVPWMASFTMMVLLRLSSVVPQAPGNLGAFQWVAARTLMMFGLGTALAKRFSLILWAVVTLPLIVIGFFAITMEGLNLSHLHKEATGAAKDSRKIA